MFKCNVIEYLWSAAQNQQNMQLAPASRKVLRYLQNWEGERASNSRNRDCGRQFQAEGPTQAKLLDWAITECTCGTTIRPRKIARRSL